MLTEQVALARARLETDNTAREQALKECREIIRMSSQAIRAIHRKEFEDALEQIAAIKRIVMDQKARLCSAPSIYHAGYIHDAAKEYVEAEAMLVIAKGGDIPTLSQVGVEPAAYLNGLAEAGSEARRYVLDRLRDGEFDEASRILALMDDIYFELITVDFPDAITGGLRRTTDAFRAVLERTRGDLTLTSRQRSLEVMLRNLEAPKTA